MSGKLRFLAVIVGLLAIAGVEAGDWTISAAAQPLFVRPPIAAPAGAPPLKHLAQSGRSFNFFDFLFGPPRSRRPRTRVQPPDSDSPSSDGAAVAPLAVPKDPGAQRVYVFGDAMAAGLAVALKESFSETPTVEVFERTRGDSGFVRYDHYDWSEVLANILANEEVNAAVFMIGSNDRQPMRLPDGTRPQTRSSQWERVYIARVDDILRQFSQRNIPVYWVGLPIMRQESYAQDIAYLNEVYLARAQRAGARFVDTWARFADENGEFSPVGPDVNGKIRRLRADNGIYLTPTGNKKLAFFVEQVLGADLEASGLARITNLGAGVLPGMRGPVEIELSLTSPGTPPANATLAGAPTREQGAGPAGGLTGEAASEVESVVASDVSGALASAAVDERANGVSSEPESISTTVTASERQVGRPDYRLMVLGESPSPEPGRADDFSWPRGGRSATR